MIPRPKVEQKVIPTVSNQDVTNLLASVNPDLVRSNKHKFRAIRDRAMLFLLIDTPGRKAELAGLRVDAVDLDLGRILVMGKGRRERWMPLGVVAREVLWEWIQLRSKAADGTNALWIDISKRLWPD